MCSVYVGPIVCLPLLLSTHTHTHTHTHTPLLPGNFGSKTVLEVPLVARTCIPGHVLRQSPPSLAIELREVVIDHFWPGPYRWKHQPPTAAAVERDRLLKQSYIALHNGMPFDEPCTYVGRQCRTSDIEIADAWANAAVGCMFKRRPVAPQESEWNTSAAAIKDYLLKVCPPSAVSHITAITVAAHTSHT